MKMNMLHAAVGLSDAALLARLEALAGTEVRPDGTLSVVPDPASPAATIPTNDVSGSSTPLIRPASSRLRRSNPFRAG
jgi:hypothetical protein